MTLCKLCMLCGDTLFNLKKNRHLKLPETVVTYTKDMV